MASPHLRGDNPQAIVCGLSYDKNTLILKGFIKGVQSWLSNSYAMACPPVRGDNP